MSVVWLIQSREDILVMPAATAVLLHHSAMGTETDCRFVSTAYRVNIGYDFSYFISVT